MGLDLQNLRHEEKIAPHTTFGIGGIAKYYLEAKTKKELIRAIERAREEGIRIWIVAGGSNLACSDEYFDGLFLRYNGGAISLDGNRITVDGGVRLSTLVEVAVANGLMGLEMLSGIPGTVGGATVGNAGAYGRNIGQMIESAEVYDRKKDATFVLPKTECEFTYGNSIFKRDKGKNWIVLSVTLFLSVGNVDELKKTSEEIITKRKKAYPEGIKCPGCFFKNVLAKDVDVETVAKLDQSKIIDGKIPAGYLVEKVNGKGLTVGGLSVASFHGNLILNDGTATFDDVINIASELKKRVHNAFGIELEEEVRYIKPID
jgi:UDP-N-acetylmuramate dehydrogenase